MSLPTYFISCDWGTSNFRLRVLETTALKVLAEHKTNQGVRTLYEKFLTQDKLHQKAFFSAYLQEQILKLPAVYRSNLLVLSGMASSNIGLEELDYADLPLHQSGVGLVWKFLSLPNELQVLLISGAKSQTGMMRGEEVQAIGLGEQLEASGSGILLLPGTHSKHVDYEEGRFTDLKTFMTGELFELLSQKSILANNIQQSLWEERRESAFKEGLALGFDGKLSSSLFSIRARNLLQNAKKEANYYLLSGLLIGDELAYLKNKKETIFLAAAEPIFSMYQFALNLILEPQQLVSFDSKALEKAFLIGQKKILELHDR